MTKTKNKTITVGYVNAFSFSDANQQSELGGHPIPGRVYQLIKLNDEYLLQIGKALTKSNIDGIMLGPSLVGSFHGKWEFDISEITQINIHEFDISPDDIEVVAKWVESGNKELNHLIDVSTLDPTPEIRHEPQLSSRIDAALSGIQSLEAELKSSYEQLIANITKLKETSPVLVECVGECVKNLALQEEDAINNAPRSYTAHDFLLFSETPDISVYNAILALQQYSIRKNPEYLQGALYYIFMELQRIRITNG